MQDPITQEGAPVLRSKARAVRPEEFDTPALHAVLDRMITALAPEEDGVAIAAPQVGEPLRIFVVSGKAFTRADHLPDDDPAVALPPKVFINPEIVRTSKKQRIMHEGCLSVRGKYGIVLRHEKATVRAQDEHGKVFTYHGSGLIAQIFQHETDHLEGVLYIDRAEEVTDDAHAYDNLN